MVRRSLPAPTFGRTHRMIPLVLALGVWLMSFAWLDFVNPPFVAWDDGIRDQLMARDCTDLGHCHRIGAAASVRDVHQGAVWIDLLVAARLLGSDTTTQRAAVFVLLGASVATLFLVVWRWLRPSLALPAAALYLAALSSDTYLSLLTNASLVAFPAVLAAASLLCWALSGRRGFLLASAFAVGVGINVHVATSSLVPSLAVLAMLVGPRPWSSLFGAMLVVLLVYLLTSSGALSANVAGLAGRVNLIAVLAGCIAALLLVLLFRSPYRRLGWYGRAWIVGIVLLAPLALASLWLISIEEHHFSFFYLHPILAPAAVLAAAVFCLPFELLARWNRVIAWMPAAAIVAAVLYFGWYEGRYAAFAAPTRAPHWTLAESRAIFEWAAERGWTYEDLLFHVQGDACRELVIGMSLAAPPPRSEPRDDRRQLQVAAWNSETAGELANGAEIVRLGDAPVARVREIDSWLRPHSLRACRLPADPAKAAACASATLPPAESLSSERFLFVSRAYPQIHHLDLPPPYVAVYEIPLSPAPGETRDVRIIDGETGKCGWKVTRVEGVETEARLPTRRLQLRSSDGAPGLLVVERPWGIADCSVLDYGYPPCFLETKSETAGANG